MFHILNSFFGFVSFKFLIKFFLHFYLSGTRIRHKYLQLGVNFDSLNFHHPRIQKHVISFLVSDCLIKHTFSYTLEKENFWQFLNYVINRKGDFQSYITCWCSIRLKPLNTDFFLNNGQKTSNTSKFVNQSSFTKRQKSKWI